MSNKEFLILLKKTLCENLLLINRQYTLIIYHHSKKYIIYDENGNGHEYEQYDIEDINTYCSDFKIIKSNE
jgi:hypothetical protein